MDRLPPSLTKGRERSPFNGFDVTGIQIIQGPNVGTRHWVGIQKKKYIGQRMKWKFQSGLKASWSSCRSLLDPMVDL